MVCQYKLITYIMKEEKNERKISKQKGMKEDNMENLQ